jgi:hypothetical protein
MRGWAMILVSESPADELEVRRGDGDLVVGEVRKAQALDRDPAVARPRGIEAEAQAALAEVDAELLEPEPGDLHDLDVDEDLALGLVPHPEELLGQNHGLGRVADGHRVEILVDLDGRDLVHRFDHLDQSLLDVLGDDVGQVEGPDGVELVLHPLLDVVRDDDDGPFVDDPEEVLARDAQEAQGRLEVLAGQVDGQGRVAEGLVVDEIHARHAPQGLEDGPQRDLGPKAQVQRLPGAPQRDRPLEPFLGRFIRLGGRREESSQLLDQSPVGRVESQGLLVGRLGVGLISLGGQISRELKVLQAGRRPGPHQGQPVNGFPGIGQSRLFVVPDGFLEIPVELGLGAHSVFVVEVPGALLVVIRERRAGGRAQGQHQNDGDSLHGLSPHRVNVFLSEFGPSTTISSGVMRTTR